MRAVSSDSGNPNDDARPGARAAARTALLRKTRLRSLALEPLEERALMSGSTLPAVTTNPALNTTLAGSTGNQVNPSVSVDPTDPTKMVAVWVQDDPAHPYTNFGGVAETAFVEGAYSTNSGKTWSPLFGSLGNGISDFSASPATAPLPLITDASVAFDANHNFYIADEAHKGDYTVGQVTTERFSFVGNAPTQTMFDNVVSQWTKTVNAVYKPILTADGNHTTINGQTDPGTAYLTAGGGGPFGAVYLVATTDFNATNPTLTSQVVQLTSFDGGQNFARTTVSGGEQASAPAITVSQGNTSKTVKAGQATIVWDNTNPTGNADSINSSTSVPDANTYANTVSPGTPVNTPPPPTPTNLTITPAVTTIPLNISGAPFNFSLVKLTAQVNLTYPDLREISIQLVAPNNQSLFLLKNGETATAAVVAGNAVVTTTPVAPAQGANGAGNNLNATFDDNGSTPIKGSNGNNGAPTTFTAEGGTLTNAFGGLSGFQADGVWKLVITGYVPDNGPSSVNQFSLSLNGVDLGVEKTVVSLTPNSGIRGNVNGGNFSDAGTTLAAPNRGIDPAPAIAADNSIGVNSPHEGRIYVTYVDRNTSAGNPADNTDIFLVSSDDGGATWSPRVKVNDDNAQADGFSEGTRPQFQPSVAVDPASGMVAVSFFDARNDAARARVATYVGTSIDGGATFSPETYVNAPQQAVDQATNQVVTLGPIPDNQSAGNGSADTSFNFGDHQALLFYNGTIMPFWSSNLNGGVNLVNGPGGNVQLSQISTAFATAPVGPRVLSVSQGPVGELNDGLNPNPSATSGPSFGKFQINFDRPVNVGSFNASDIQVIHEDVNGVKTTYAGGYTIAATAPVNGYASAFTVTLNNAQAGLGTYSIAVAPTSPTDIRTDVQYFNGATLVSTEAMDQDTVPSHAGLNTNVYPTSNPAGTGPDITLPLIVTGPHVVGSSTAGSSGADNLVKNGTVSFIDVKFDRNMDPTTLVGHPEIVLRMIGPAGLIADKFAVSQPNPGDLTTYRFTFLNPTTGLPDPQTLNGTYTLTFASTVKDSQGNPLDTNLNAGLYRFRGVSPYGASTPVNYVAPVPGAGLPIPDPAAPVANTLLVPVTVPDTFLVQGVSVNLSLTYPYDPDLTAYLLAPGAFVNPDGTVSGTYARLFSNVGGSGSQANFTNTTFVSSTSPNVTPISGGGPPFLNGTFDALDPFTPFQNLQAKGTWQLYIQDAQTKPASGTLNSFTLTLNENVSAATTGLGEPVADQATVGFRIFTVDPTNAQSTNTWTSAGPAGLAGRVGGLAVDPSDPSGNTVYAGGASGGIWKTTNFLTAGRPTWTPLTDFGPTSDNNIGALAVFPVNNDPNQSIIFAGTGEADTGTSGKGFLRSSDGGAHWVFLDSTDNSLPYASRDHLFANNGTTTFKVIVDPKLNANGQVIVYAALSGNGAGPVAGVWRSFDSGVHWTRLKGGNATDVAFDNLSGTGSPGGNLQIVYAAFGGDGVYMSPNQGQSFFKMLGTAGNPLIQDATTNKPDPVVTPAGSTPNGASKTRIQIVTPALTGVSGKDLIYQGYLYALVSNGDDYDGLYLTKDFGQNWTKVHIATAAGIGQGYTNPSNNVTLPDYDTFGGQGSYNMSLGIDPTNPNVTYIGGSSNPKGGATGNRASGYIRVDATGILDAHNAAPYSGSQPDGGKIQRNTAGGVSPIDNTKGFAPLNNANLPYINLIRNPANFFANSTFNTANISQFNNTGADAKWVPFGGFGGTDQHKLLTIIDPLTGHARLIEGDDQGVFTGIDDNGSSIGTGSVGTASIPSGSRNGNLEFTQFYYGAAQPSAHTPTGTVRPLQLYGGAQDTGAPASGDVFSGNLFWGGAGGDATGVETDPTGSGSVYRFIVPANAMSDFFQVDGIGRTFGLNNVAGDPATEWGYAPVGEGPNLAVGLFAVNPVNGNQILISSALGIVYRTEDRGSTWFVVGAPTDLDGSHAPALAFGAPAAGSNNQDNFLYAGTVNGNIFVTTTGGGSGGGNAWANVSAGLAGSGIIRQIIADPNPGSKDAYAVAQNGVYYNPDSTAAGSTWAKITGNLFSLKTPATGDVVTALGDAPGAPTQSQQLSYLTSMQVDWRYLLPNQPGNPGAGTHPVIYVGGDSGVYRSLDRGATWTDFPNTDPQIDNAPVNGGYLPHVPITSMSLSVGNIDPTTGRATISQANGVKDPSLLSLSTYGQGSFFIQLAPVILPNVTSTNPINIYLDPTAPNNLAGTTVSGLQYTSNPVQIFDGISEQSAFGNVVSVQAFDETPGSVNFGKPIPGATAATDGNGLFKLTVNNYFTGGATYTVGFQATDQSGTKGNMATFDFVVNGPPLAPTSVTLDPASDTGRLNGDSYTNDNNSAAHPAPVFDVTGIQAPINSNPTTVVLLRATEINGVIGAYSIVNTVTTLTGGTVQIADTNAGAGQIADTPVNTAIDTAPPQPNQYVYTAYQVNSLGTKGPQNVPGTNVIVDSTLPNAPSGITLDTASDSGPSTTDGYTNANNTAAHPAPLFDITGVEPHATVYLLRDGVVVSTIADANPLGAKNMVQIADTNNGAGAIPDSPTGSPIDTISAATPYTYSSYQVDLAGNVSGIGKPVFGNKGAVVIDGTDADLHGDNAGPGGTNETGWLYMQKVLNLVAPNISNGKKTLVALGADPSLGNKFGAAAAINSAFLQSSLPGKGWNIVFVTGAANIDTYLSGANTPALDITNTAIPGGVTTAQTGFLYITTNGPAPGDLTNAELVVVDKHGPDIANFVNNGGGLYAQTENPVTYGGGGSGPPAAFGWLSAIFPGLVGVEDGTQSPNGFTITPAGAAAFPTLTTADVSSGPWHSYFTGNLGGLVVAMTAQDSKDVTQNLILTSAGGGGAIQALGVIVDATPPATPDLTLDPGSVTGGIPNNTQDNNGKYPAPTFDVTNVEPNATVRLYRTPVDASGAPTGPQVLVNTLVQSATAAPATVQIVDNNGGGGVIPNGMYLYTVIQSDLAGNPSVVTPASVVIVTVNAGLPTPPLNLTLDPASDTAAPNDGVIKFTKDNNGPVNPAPQFDVSGGLIAGGTLELFRAPSVNGVAGTAVLVDTVVSPGGGAGTILDTNNGGGVIPDGTYVYTTRQKDLSGNESLPSNAVTVTIDSKPAQKNPPSAPVLEAASDTGTFSNDGVTQDNNGATFPAPKFDAGANGNPIEKGATIRLYRTPTNAQFVPTGPAVLVNTVFSAAGGLVPIADTNAGGGVIPDGHYLYTIQLTSLAGVLGTLSPSTRITIGATNPATPSPLQLDPTSDTGVSKTDAITQITLFGHPKFNVGPTVPVLPGATVVLYRAPLVNGSAGTAVAVNTLTDTPGGTVQITDPGIIPDGQYVYTVQQVDLEGNPSPVGGPITVTYDTNQPATPATPVLDGSNPGNPANGQTSNPNPIIDVTVNPTPFEAGLGLTLTVTLVRDGTPVAFTPYSTSSGVLKITDPAVNLSQGIHTYQAFVTDVAGNKSALSGTLTVTIGAAAPGSLSLDPASYTGLPGSNTTSVTNPTFDAFGVTPGGTLRLLRDGQTVASIANTVGGTVKIQDPGPLQNGTYVYSTVQVDSKGNTSDPGPGLMVTINTSVPTTPFLVRLDLSADSGTKGDNITNDKTPTFDVTQVSPGATLQLYRDSGDGKGSVKVPSVPFVTGTTATISDSGPVPDGTYLYTVRQVNAANNPSAASGGIYVKVIAASPAAPVVTLDSASTSGANVAGTTSPSFDVFVVPGNSVQLYRGNLLVKSVTNASTSPVVLQDFGPLTEGQSYDYTAKQTDVAGNISPASASLTITVNTAAPVGPAAPTSLALAPSADSGIKGDRITDVRMPSFTGKADPGALINLYAGGNDVVGTAVANSLGNFTVQIGTPVGLGAPLTNGYYSFVAQAYVNGHVSGGSTPVVVKIAPEFGDFTGNGNTQPSLFRRTTGSQLQWFVLNDGDINGRSFGVSATDVPIVGDFSGAGRMDLVVFSPSTGNWTIEKATTNYAQQAFVNNFGAPPANAPAGHADFYTAAPGDYNGSGTQVPAVYENTTGKWYILGRPAATPPITTFQAGDIPVPGDYDNTGKDELALYRPSTATWYIQGAPADPNAFGVHVVSGNLYTVSFGGNGDIPVPAAYFATAGDHSVTEAVWRPGTDSYLIRTANGGTKFAPFALGGVPQAGDVPAPGDYNGSGVIQPGVYRPFSNPPVFLTSTPVNAPANEAVQVVAPIGGTNFVPLLSPYSYRALKSGGGTVSAFAVKAGTLDFASTAVTLTSSTTTPPAAPAQPARPAVTLLRVRPAQAVAPKAATPVDHALASLGVSVKGRLFGGLL